MFRCFFTPPSHTAGIIDSPANSLFTYQPGESWATYYDPYFVPTYLAEFFDPDLAAQANELCGNDPFCLFDIAATGRVDIGLSTLQGSQEFEEIEEISLPGSYITFACQRDKNDLRTQPLKLLCLVFNIHDH